MHEFNGFEDLLEQAQKYLPRIVFEYIEGGASALYSLEKNRRDFLDLHFMPKVLIDISKRSTATTVLGRNLKLPVIAGPAGLAPIVHPDGELAAARAASNAGSIFCVSNASGYSLEEIAKASGDPVWFQLFSCFNREIASGFIERAKRAECDGLILGVDLPIGGLRYRDARNGMEFPPRLSLENIVDFTFHIRWLINAVKARKKIRMGNYDAILQQRPDIDDAQYFLKNEVLDPGSTWEDFKWLRDNWDGKLIVKGIMNPVDAASAVSIGADAVVVSNHGGRQLDGQESTIASLPGVVEEIQGKADIFIDGGIRHGADVVKALALGATACFVARPWYLALSAGGERGVDAMFKMFANEIDNVMGLLGCNTIDELDRTCLR